jgi:hypothetical protein
MQLTIAEVELFAVEDRPDQKPEEAAGGDVVGSPERDEADAADRALLRRDTAPFRAP